jgi:hypothetical protein
MELMQKRYESEIGILQHRVNEAIDERDSARAKATRTKSKYGKAKEKWNDEKYNMTIKINGLEDKLLKIETKREERSATADDSVICASKSNKNARNRSAPSLELLMRPSLAKMIATPPRLSTSKRHVVTSNASNHPIVEQSKYEDEETTEDISKENFVLPANTPSKIFGTTIGGSAPGTPATPGTPGTPSRSRKRKARRKDKKQLLKQLNM